MKETYGTLSQTINALKEEGYTHDFNISQGYFFCNQSNKLLSPEEFEIDKVFRFEGQSNPDDQSVLYAISSSKFGIKGLLVNGYGISSEPAVDAMIAKLNTYPQH